VKLKLQSSSVDFAELGDMNQKTRDTQRNKADGPCVVELTIMALCDSNDKKRARRLEIDRRSAKMAREQVKVDHEEISLIRDQRRCLQSLRQCLRRKRSSKTTKRETWSSATHRKDLGKE
jgi:hypothetical protein